MAVGHRVMAVEVAMWLASVTAFMFMLVMFVVHMQVRMVHGLVRMLEFNHIARGPQDGPGYGRTHNKQGESSECRR
jgi:hypothetical protein